MMYPKNIIRGISNFKWPMIMYWLVIIFFFKLKVKDLNLFINNFFFNFQRIGRQALCSSA